MIIEYDEGRKVKMKVKEFLSHMSNNTDITDLWIECDIEVFHYHPHLCDEVICDFGDSDVDCWHLSVYSDDIVELIIYIK